MNKEEKVRLLTELFHGELFQLSLTRTSVNSYRNRQIFLLVRKLSSCLDIADIRDSTRTP